MSNTTDPTRDTPIEGQFLILMRHAKSDWGDEALTDHDRPLNSRGRRDAPRMARWLESVGLVPDRILSSTAQRTRETVSLMSQAWTNSPHTMFRESLYLATAETMLQSISQQGRDASRLMVLAHNPGIAHLVSHLSDQFVDMPTAAIAIFQLEKMAWNRIRPDQTMNLVHYMRPKAL